MARVLRDAIAAVGAVVVQSASSGVIALATAVVYSFGCFWTGRSPAQQSRREFLTANMASLSVFYVLSLALGFSTSLARHRSVSRPLRAPSHFFWFTRLLRVAWLHIVGSTVMILAVTVASTRLSMRWTPYLVHFYVSALWIQYVTAVLDVLARMLYRTETIDGLAKHKTTTRPRTPTWTRIARAYVHNLGHLLSLYTASAYIHLSSRLALETEHTFVIFSVVSMVLRCVVMKVVLTVVARRHKIPLRLLYVLTAVPAVMISTQVRIALLRVKGNVSTTSVVVLALVEPVMRILKVWRVRREVNQTQRGPLPRSVSMTLIVPAVPVAITDDAGQALAVLRHRRRSRFDSGAPAQLLLQFTAAEIHADMCAEYIAVACSLAIYFCLGGHPRFAWPVDTSDPSSTADGWRRVELVVLQLAVELVVDTVCCAWELVNGIPLHTRKEIGRFQLGIFAGCAVANVGVCCSIYIK